MSNARYSLPISYWMIVILLLVCVPLWAVGRTTPVEVVNTPLVGIDPNNSTVKAAQIEPWDVYIQGTPNFNVANSPTVKIDSTTNTVKSAQSGTWNVGVSSLPTVSVNTHPVTQSGTWNVGINNNPSVAQSGTWNVGISDTANTVKTPPQAQMVRLWTDSNELAVGAKLYSPYVYTAGYRQVHVVMVCNPASSDVRAALLVKMGDGGVTEIGKARFLSPTPGFLQGGGFIVSQNYLTFSFQVISDMFQIRIDNDSTLPITVYGNCYAYLTN